MNVLLIGKYSSDPKYNFFSELDNHNIYLHDILEEDDILDVDKLVINTIKNKSLTTILIFSNQYFQELVNYEKYYSILDYQDLELDVSEIFKKYKFQFLLYRYPERKVIQLLKKYPLIQSFQWNYPLTQNIFKNLNLPKQFDILYLDNYDEKINIEDKVFTILKELDKKKLIKLKLIEEKDLSNNELSKIINESYLTFFYYYHISSINWEFYQKIISSNSCLLTNIQAEKIKNTEFNFLYLDCEQKEIEIKNNILKLLKNKDDILKNTGIFTKQLIEQINSKNANIDLELIFHMITDSIKGKTPIISYSKGGLGNRIKNFISCLRYSDECRTPCKIYWEIIDNYSIYFHLFNCPFELLFEKPENLIINEIPKYSFTYKYSNFLVLESDNLISPDMENSWNIDFQYNKIPSHVKNSYLPYFQKLKLHTDLKDKINAFSEKFNKNTISVHIRSWSQKNENLRCERLFQKGIQKYESLMNNYPQYNFFLSTDSDIVKKYFTKISILKNKIITYPRETLINDSRNSSLGIQEDLIELYLLSKNKNIIGSRFSTFTEIAWWLAGCPNSIIIP